jgi:tetratricopeptide (TPR) repeat protein
MIELADDLTHSLDAENPWPGLMPFTEATRAFFHGRDAEAAELLRRVRRERLTILFGQSGLGKTSLLFAGLFPRLRTADFLPVYLRLDPVNVRLSPVAQIKRALAQNLVEHGIEGRPPRSDETLWEYFHDKGTEFWSRRNRLVTPVLVLDQFEEIFTLGHAVPSVDVVIDELAALVENRPPGSVRAAFEDDPEAARRYDFAKESCKLVFALREDFLPDLEGLRRRMPSMVENRMRLTRMDGRQARDAILASGSHLVGPGVTEKVIAFVAASRSHSAGEAVDEAELAGLEIEPALLSIVCSELNNKRLRLGHAQITPDLLEGAQQEIVAQFYESSLTGIDPAVKLFIEEQLLTSEGYRDTRPLAEALREPGVTRTDIDRLVARRLLRIEERFGTQWVELTHDLLTGVIRQRRDLRREQTQASREAEARAQAERERAERAERAEAEASRERKEREVQTALAREAAERERLARRLVRRTQIALAATALALVVAVGAGVYAWDQRRLAEEQATEAAQQRQIAEQRAAEAAQQRQLAEEHSEEGIRIQYLVLHALIGNVGVNQYKALVQNLRAYQTTIERLAAIDPSDIGRRKELAIIHFWVGVGLNSLGDNSAKLAEFKEYQAIMAQLAGTDLENRVLQRDLAVSHMLLGAALADSNDVAGALAEERASIALFEVIALEDPGDETLQGLLGAAHKATGFMLIRQGDGAGAVAEWRAYRAFVTQASAKTEADLDWWSEHASIDRQIGDALRAQGDLPGALKEFQTELAFRTGLASKNPGNTDRVRELSVSLNRIGAVTEAQGDPSGAAEKYRAALGFIEELTKNHPSNDGWQADLSFTHDRLGDALQTQGDLAGALREFRARLAIEEALAAKSPADSGRQRELASAHNKVGYVLSAQHDNTGAASEFRAAADVARHGAEQEAAKTDWQGILVTALIGLGVAQLDAGDPTGALSASEEALKTQRQLYSAGATLQAKAALVQALGQNSFVLLFTRRAPEAAKWAEEALALDPSAVWIETNRAHAYLFLGRFDEAKAIYLDNKDKRVPGGRTFAKAVIDDFEMFRKNGIDIPAMHEIETLLSS